jgi:pimeloyl-ACP methyl ester carboxylesterase
MPVRSVAGGRLYYEERGSGVPVLGIHGTGSSARLWEDAATRLADHGRVITYDRRGGGRSERWSEPKPTSVEAHAADAAALLQSLDAAPAIVIGRSYGGTIAIELAVRHPKVVAGLVLLEAGPVGLDATYDAWFWSLADAVEAAATERGVEAAGEALLRAVVGAWDELPETYREVFSGNGPAILAELRAGERLSDGVRLEDVQVPTLVLTGDTSGPALQAGSEAAARRIPGARAVRVAEGHAIDPAHPEVIDFIRELTRERRP